MTEKQGASAAPQKDLETRLIFLAARMSEAQWPYGGERDLFEAIAELRALKTTVAELKKQRTQEQAKTK